MDLSKATWRKARQSAENGGNCIELAGLSGKVGVRDSKDPDGPVLLVSPTALRAAVHAAVQQDSALPAPA